MDGAGSASAAVAATPARRKKRSAAERLRIVEETLLPGASVARVARSHGINANQVFAWRKLHLAGKLVSRRTVADTTASRLLPVSVSETASPLISDVAGAPAAISCPTQPSAAAIQIQLPKAQIRVEGGADLQVLRAVLECLLG